jgi:hypothetical protein
LAHNDALPDSPSRGAHDPARRGDPRLAGGARIAARLEGGRGDSLSERRIATLEGEVDRLARELQRLDEESAFLHQLLEKKRSPDALPPGEQHD